VDRPLDAPHQTARGRGSSVHEIATPEQFGDRPVTSAIAEQLDVEEANVRQALKRDIARAERRRTASMFTRVDGGLIGLAQKRAS